MRLFTTPNLALHEQSPTPRNPFGHPTPGGTAQGVCVWMYPLPALGTLGRGMEPRCIDEDLRMDRREECCALR